MSTPSPLADVSYRPYDGPLDKPAMRWIVIARQHIRTVFKRKAYWITTVVSSWYYLVLSAIIYFMEQAAMAAAQMSPDAQAVKNLMDFTGRLVWKDQFLHGFAFAQLPYMLIALMVGSGAIAHDNRANALQVYLSKPCTRTDYMIGKFMGVFVPIFLSMILPPAVFYLNGTLSYSAYGFFTHDPWLFPKVALGIFIAAAVYAAIVTSLSSLFRNGRMAAATFACIFIILNIFAGIMVGISAGLKADQRSAAQPPVVASETPPVVEEGAQTPREERRNRRRDRLRNAVGSNSGEAFIPITEKLGYASVDGLAIGAFKAILKTDGTPPFGIQVQDNIPHPAPPLPLALTACVGAFAGSFLLMAWRVRAVEVVR